MSERKANEILKHSELYNSDPVFKQMLDNTVYLTQEEKEKSISTIDLAYGVVNGRVGGGDGS